MISGCFTEKSVKQPESRKLVFFPNIQGSENPRCFQKFLVGRRYKKSIWPLTKGSGSRQMTVSQFAKCVVLVSVVSWCGTRRAASGSEGAFVARHATHARNASDDFLLSASAHISSPDSKPRRSQCSLQPPRRHFFIMFPMRPSDQQLPSGIISRLHCNTSALSRIIFAEKRILFHHNNQT